MPVQTPDMTAQVAYRIYQNRENNIRHHYYEEEMKPYRLMQKGDLSCVDESQRLMHSDLMGKLSEDPLKDARYTFVAGITLATRFAIEGGMDSETAYILSDLYIRRMDGCTDREAVLRLFGEVMYYYTLQMQLLIKKPEYSLHVHQCLNYITQHLHEPVRLKEIAAHLGLNQNYLSELFCKETGSTFSDYVLQQRIEAAKPQLLDTDLSAAQIAQTLAFSSQSYFIRVFKKQCGVTPGTFRKYGHKNLLQAAAQSTRLNGPPLSGK